MNRWEVFRSFSRVLCTAFIVSSIRIYRDAPFATSEWDVRFLALVHALVIAAVGIIHGQDVAQRWIDSRSDDPVRLRLDEDNDAVWDFLRFSVFESSLSDWFIRISIALVIGLLKAATNNVAPAAFGH